jgi:peptidoglycan/LPS O-acetylase OafA/YrhL
MGRSILAVVAGFLLVVVLSVGTDKALEAAGVFPAMPADMGNGLFALATTYRAVFTVLGGILTGLLTLRADQRDVRVLAALGFLAGLAGIAAWFATPGLGPLWYAVLIPVTGAPAALIGGQLARLIR